MILDILLDPFPSETNVFNNIYHQCVKSSSGFSCESQFKRLLNHIIPCREVLRKGHWWNKTEICHLRLILLVEGNWEISRLCFKWVDFVLRAVFIFHSSPHACAGKDMTGLVASLIHMHLHLIPRIQSWWGVSPVFSAEACNRSIKLENNNSLTHFSCPLSILLFAKALQTSKEAFYTSIFSPYPGLIVIGTCTPFGHGNICFPCRQGGALWALPWSCKLVQRAWIHTRIWTMWTIMDMREVICCAT